MEKTRTREAAADPIGADWRTALLRARETSPGPSRIQHVAARLASIEEAILAAPDACFSFDPDGTGTLTAANRSYCAGRFSIPTLGELRARLVRRATHGSLRLSAIEGTGALSDIGMLQATAPPGLLFQAASQFNCLESPSAQVVPVRDYVTDPTQGPRASVSAFPGTFLRHYRAPRQDGNRFVQTDGDCLELLAGLFDAEVAVVQSGYLMASNIRRADALAEALVERFLDIRVGIHADVEVVFGANWAGAVTSPPPHRIAQAFTSTIALGGYGRDDGSAAIAIARRQLLRAAYLGTLLGALDLGAHTVVLTLIGGGVFGNPHRDIWDAIHWAIAEVGPLACGDVDVIVNGRDGIPDQDRRRIRDAGGVVLDLRSLER